MKPELLVGQPVRVILNERNKTLHTGAIRQIIWHSKDQRFNYYIAVDGKKVSKRYFIEDLEAIA